MILVKLTCPNFLLLKQGKHDPRANDLPIDNAKNPHFLVLLSENFLEARAAFNRAGVPSSASNQNPVKMDMAPITSVTGPPPTSMPSGYLLWSNWFSFFSSMVYVDASWIAIKLFLIHLTLFSFIGRGALITKNVYNGDHYLLLSRPFLFCSVSLRVLMNYCHN